KAVPVGAAKSVAAVDAGVESGPRIARHEHWRLGRRHGARQGGGEARRSGDREQAQCCEEYATHTPPPMFVPTGLVTPAGSRMFLEGRRGNSLFVAWQFSDDRGTHGNLARKPRYIHAPAWEH